jgi:hypothetical protein
VRNVGDIWLQMVSNLNGQVTNNGNLRTPASILPFGRSRACKASSISWQFGGSILHILRSLKSSLSSPFGTRIALRWHDPLITFSLVNSPISLYQMAGREPQIPVADSPVRLLCFQPYQERARNVPQGTLRYYPTYQWSRESFGLLRWVLDGCGDEYEGEDVTRELQKQSAEIEKWRWMM